MLSFYHAASHRGSSYPGSSYYGKKQWKCFRIIDSPPIVLVRHSVSVEIGKLFLLEDRLVRVEAPVPGGQIRVVDEATSGLADTQLASAKLLVITVTRLLIAVTFLENHTPRTSVTTMISPAIAPPQPQRGMVSPARHPLSSQGLWVTQ